MPKINIKELPAIKASVYPGELGDIVEGRQKTAIGNAGGLTQFGVNLTRINPGSASAHRHWHAMEDEFLYVLEGEGVLIEDEDGSVSETSLVSGDMACFKAGVAIGHHVVNRSDTVLVLLEVGTRSFDEEVTYTDENVDMRVCKKRGEWFVTRKDGRSF